MVADREGMQREEEEPDVGRREGGGGQGRGGSHLLRCEYLLPLKLGRGCS